MHPPASSQLVNADMLKGSITASETLNRYAYANGNPVSLIDPFGTCAEWGYYLQTASGFNGHDILNAAGLIPGVGAVFDGINDYGILPKVITGMRPYPPPT